MSSIPLPALDIKPVQQPNSMEQLGQLMALRNQMQEQPLRMQALQQQVQASQLENQQRQLQLQDSQTLRTISPSFVKKDSSGNVTGYDFDGFFNKAAQSGVSPQTLAALQKSISDATLAKANVTKAQLDNQQTLNTQAFQHLEGLRGTKDPAERQQLWNSALQWVGQNAQGLGVNPAAIPQQAPDDNGLSTIEASLGMHAQQLADASKLAENQKNAAQGQEATAHTQQIQQQMSYGPTGPAAEAKYRFILQKKASGQPLTPDEVNFARGFEASQAKSTTQSDSLGVTSSNFSKPAGLSAVGSAVNRPLSSSNLPSSATGSVGATSPASVKGNIVDEIGQYKMDPALMGRALYKHPELLGMISAKYPNWDQTAYQAKNRIVQSYTSGPESRSINAIGTALGHANELRDAIDALGNGDDGLKVLRNLGNQLGVQVGSDKVTAFNTIVHRLAPEITAAYVQGGGGEGERTASAADFSPSLSKQQLVQNWSETVKLLQSKIAQQKQQWDTTFKPSQPQDDFYTRFLSPVAKQAISRWTAETGNQSAISGAGVSAGGGNFFSQFGGKAH